MNSIAPAKTVSGVPTTQRLIGVGTARLFLVGIRGRRLRNNAGDLQMVSAWASLRFIVLTTDTSGNVGFDFEPSDKPPPTS